MTIIPAVSEMQYFAAHARQKLQRIGFVPTMGYLHEGHMSLVRIARKLSDVIVLSSFVNPIQFGPKEDFVKYPRNDARDDRLCEKEGVDVVFRPSVDEMYQGDHSVYVDETKLSAGLCGRFRQGHFRGVATIVTKLFNIVQPHIAVFGGKDAQQARLIEQMVRDLNFSVQIVVAPIVREPDGLAMSSRNAYLGENERNRAAGIYGSLCFANRLFTEGERDAARLAAGIRGFLQANASPLEIEYIEVVDYRTLNPVAIIESNVLVAIAVRIGQTRLIDNIMLTSDGYGVKA